MTALMMLGSTGTAALFAAITQGLAALPILAPPPAESLLTALCRKPWALPGEPGAELAGCSWLWFSSFWLDAAVAPNGLAFSIGGLFGPFVEAVASAAFAEVGLGLEENFELRLETQELFLLPPGGLWSFCAF